MAEGWTPLTLACVLFLVLVPMAIASFFWLRGKRALEELGREVEALARGRPVRRLRGRVGGPSSRLADRINEAVPDIESRIARLEDDRRKLDAVLSGMAEGVLAVDARQRILFANPAAQRMFRLAGGADGRLVIELVRSPQIQMAVEATLAGRGAYRAELSLPGRNPLAPDQERTIAVHGTPLPGFPPPGAVLVFHDVTDLRRLERMRQDFVANASHELKTPLASIKVNTETLLDWGLHDDSVNVILLNQIDEQVDRLDNLVQDMLRLARLESSDAPFLLEPMALGPIVRACVSDHEPRARAREQRLIAECDALDDSVRVRAAEEAIRQILDNLIDNAIKYSPEGASIRIAARTDDQRVRLDVADSGPGIPRDDIPRIFERFYRVDKARSRSLGGTGLGLAIVKHLAQSLGGEVGVESQLGVGSTFTIRLPRHRETA
ncbi:sensor histidine kinase [Tautonia plasticadhaerens]|uniref:histidine kinase n=1 Tax=Tautonia plasticadhaerens TaxID=2527974 RepID=A0A518GXB1_9BACT|nr:ATP-binding protein [Tautonia plasticadhaerens]QDV33227.1 Alkaline phosphatase synthesis sensor protein PhoR [Tautonia plasticadhaerens]